jgi:AbiV family abortive infection protein
MPAAGQLRQLAQAAVQNATDLAADARLLLDAGRFPRAHALATLALEELGKVVLCKEVLAGRLDDKSFRREWPNHPSKLDRSRLLAVLSAPTVERVFATAEDDSETKLRGLYVDLNPADPSGAPLMPSGVGPVLAREMVETSEEATRLAAGGPYAWASCRPEQADLARQAPDSGGR